jgi:hypothetical protein
MDVTPAMLVLAALYLLGDANSEGRQEQSGDKSGHTPELSEKLARMEWVNTSGQIGSRQRVLFLEAVLCGTPES